MGFFTLIQQLTVLFTLLAARFIAKDLSKHFHVPFSVAVGKRILHRYRRKQLIQKYKFHRTENNHVYMAQVEYIPRFVSMCGTHKTLYISPSPLGYVAHGS